MLIDMAIQDIMDIANTYVAKLEDVADRQSGQPMRDIKVERSAYSQVPAAQRLGAQHEAAQEVFLATVEGVVKDLAERTKIDLSSREEVPFSIPFRFLLWRC
jgi:hypothetical protein